MADGMVAGEFVTTPERVQQASHDVELLTEEIRQEMTSLRSYVGSLEDHWRGGAHDTFLALMAEFDKAQSDANEVLEEIRQGLHGNFMTYSTVEQDVIGDLKKIQPLPAANF